MPALQALDTWRWAGGPGTDEGSPLCSSNRTHSDAEGAPGSGAWYPGLGVDFSFPQLFHPHPGYPSRMSPTTKKVLLAVFWFVLGHLSCAVMHHLHHFAGN